MKHNNTISIPGYKKAIEYTLIRQDYKFIAQHNYSGCLCDTDVVIRGWYSKDVMKDSATIVAAWHVKSFR